MKVSKDWLKELVKLNTSLDEVVKLLPLRTIGTKEVTEAFIELDMKGYNRADLLSLRGVAYEIAAITESEVKFSEIKESEYLWVERSLPKVDVKVENNNLCPVYCIAKIEILTVEQSDETWVNKLNTSGVRAINNVADITNLIMLEYGQPLHAFDANTIKDEKIIVRTAKKGEKIRTLDDKERQLGKSDLLITDPEKVVGIAGVMGGKNSEVSDQTTTILLEAAIFDPKNLRQTSQRLGLISEASKRFYHGLTKKRLLQALDAAIKMYESLGGKLTALTIVGDTEDLHPKIPLSLKKVNSLIGVELSKSQGEEYLKKLNFELTSLSSSSLTGGSIHIDSRLRGNDKEEGEPGWVITPPYYRLDIEIEEDLIEEIARMYGYEKIPAQKLEGKLPPKVDQSKFKLIQNIKNKLAQLGLTEVQTYSYFSTQVLDALGFSEETKKVLIKLQNPMSKETEYMRMNIWPNLVEVIGKNIHQGASDIAIFEVGKEYMPTPNGEVLENDTLAISIMNGTDNPLAELNQIFEKTIQPVILATQSEAWRSPESNSGVILVARQDIPPKVISYLFHPNRFMSILKNDSRVGGLAEVHPRVLDKFGIQKRVAILQIDLGLLL